MILHTSLGIEGSDSAASDDIRSGDERKRQDKPSWERWGLEPAHTLGLVWAPVQTRFGTVRLIELSIVFGACIQRANKTGRGLAPARASSGCYNGVDGLVRISFGGKDESLLA